MKRFVLAFLVLCSVMIFAACTQQVQEIENIPEKHSIDTVTNKIDTNDIIEEVNQPDFQLLTDKETYNSSDKAIFCTVKNNTGEEHNILLIPMLKKKAVDVWEEIPSIAGFCGTPDLLEESREIEVPFEWFEDLEDGEYKIGFKIIKNMGENREELELETEFKFE